ncbi:MAG: response regulator transcription factor [Candidatus Omnitrophica bacterium]|jgi:two-component system alkaline phosphatase synthesis response regulator PhoP|nr:response regulator transcription factor [Candidatus Omnitrophota bacterium]
MSGILILGTEDEGLRRARKALKEAGYQVYFPEESGVKAAYEEALSRRPDIVLVDFTSAKDFDAQAVYRAFKKDRFLKETPVFALMPEGGMQALDSIPGIGDFIFEPLNPSELVARIRALLKKVIPTDSKDTIKAGDLLIDVSRYEVTVNGGKIELTFKEYELLKFLASNKGRVYSRDQLLDKIWGYDYYGGTRTVDVHIRRLRSKIEDRRHTFIETIRNIGYKFIA